MVIGDLGTAFFPDRLNPAFRLLQDPECAFVTLVRNLYFKSAEGLTLDVEAFVAALESATSRTAELVDKPSFAFLEAAVSRMEIRLVEVLMVGDDLESDALGAQSVGLRGALVRTG